MPDKLRAAWSPRPQLNASERRRGPAVSAAPALAVAAALKLELRPLLRLSDHLCLAPSPPGAWAWSGLLGGHPVLLLRTGMGREAVERALPVLEARPLAALICAGTCGALEARLARGALLVAEQVISGEGERYGCHEGLGEAALSFARARALQACRAPLLCSARVASEPAEKRRLAEGFGAAAVDMESAALAAYAARRGVPYLAVKVVADEAAGWMLPLDAWGWLTHPLRRTLRLPLYLAGLAAVALNWREIRQGLEAAAQVVAAAGAASASGTRPASRSAAGSR